MPDCGLVLGPINFFCQEAVAEPPAPAPAPPYALGVATASALVVLLLAPVLYVLLNSVVPALLGPQNLKKKYRATWAIVTGSSSGIGKSLAKRLLQQDLNVILVARKEPLFDATVAELRTEFPEKQVVQVEANLSDESGKWMAAVESAVGGKDVQVCFLNAGYMLSGMFEQNAVTAHLANLHCNLTANVWLSHFLYGRLLAKGLGGCLVFTSSSASFIPTPFAAMYATSKSAISSFAAGLAVEGRARGIHVHAVHPSPVNSRFAQGGGNAITVRKISVHGPGQHKWAAREAAQAWSGRPALRRDALGRAGIGTPEARRGAPGLRQEARGAGPPDAQAMDFFYKFAVGPDALPDLFLRTVGRTAVVADFGGVSVGLRLLVHALGYNFIALATALTAHMTADYKNNIDKAAKKQA